VKNMRKKERQMLPSNAFSTSIHVQAKNNPSIRLTVRENEGVNAVAKEVRRKKKNKRSIVIGWKKELFME
jgi:hypothetical protein